MKKLLLILATLGILIPQIAWALLPLPTSNKPRGQRALVVLNDQLLTSFGANTSIQNQWAIENAIGDTYNVLRQQGIQVDALSTDWFLRSENFETRTVNGLPDYGAWRWRTIGDTYGLVMVDGAAAIGTKTAGPTNITRFFRPDSTNANLILIFGSRNREMSGGDSTYSMGTMNEGAFGGNYITSCWEDAYGAHTAYRVYGDTEDTLYYEFHRFVDVAGGFATGSGVTQVVRLLEPLQLTPGLSPFAGLAWGSDSTVTRYPALGDSIADPVVGANEMLGPIWRTYFSNGRWVDNFIAQFADPRTYRNYGELLYAIAARYLDVEPMLISVEMDDLFDMNNRGLRWSNGGLDSLMGRLKREYDCQPAISTNPRHAYEYMKGMKPLWELDDWTGRAWDWPRKYGMYWVYHSHDSTAASLTSNLVGRYGGYPNAGNGYAITEGGNVHYNYHETPAFRYDPNSSNYEMKYGIFNRLQESERLKDLVCPECVIGPYLSYPNNEVLPINIKPRTPPGDGTANEWYSMEVPSANVCTIDSVFLAKARGLHIPNGGTLYVRGSVHGGGFQTIGVYTWRLAGTWSPRTNYTGAEGLWGSDSVATWTPFLFPGQEMYITDKNGVTDPTGVGGFYRIRVKNIGAVAFDNNIVANNVNVMRALGNRARACLLGFWSAPNVGMNQGPLSAGPVDWYRQNQDKDLVDAFAFTGTPGQRWWSSDHPRIIYFHPQNFEDATPTVVRAQGPGQNSQTQNFEANILKPIRGLNRLAGKTIFKWVAPWEVYGE